MGRSVVIWFRLAAIGVAVASCASVAQPSTNAETTVQAASEAEPTTTTTAQATTTTTTAPIEESVVAVSPDDPAPYVKLLDYLERVGFSFPINQEEAFSLGEQICGQLASVRSGDELTALARENWSAGDDPTAESWEGTQAMYSAASYAYCPNWSMAAGMVGDSPAQLEEFYRTAISEIGEDALPVLLADQHPRSAALVLSHLPATPYVSEQLDALEEIDPSAILAISAEIEAMN